jgi:hypothetical protein
MDIVVQLYALLTTTLQKRQHSVSYGVALGAQWMQGCVGRVDQTWALWKGEIYPVSPAHMTPTHRIHDQ